MLVDRKGNSKKENWCKAERGETEKYKEEKKEVEKKKRLYAKTNGT